VLADPTYQRCPECGKTVPVDRRFVTWCEHCEWNVDPGAKDLDPVPGWQVRLETRLADTLYRELERGRIQRPGWDLARVTAYLLSLLVLILPIGFAVFGVFAVLNYRPRSTRSARSRWTSSGATSATRSARTTWRRRSTR
jgi:hypothetical protein